MLLMRGLCLIVICFSFLRAFLLQKNTINTQHRGRNAIVSSSTTMMTLKDETITPIRPLGGYERLLSRKTPGTNHLSLSHGSMFTLNGVIDHNALLNAVQKIIIRHPMLRCYIGKNERGKFAFYQVSDDQIATFSHKVLQTKKIDGIALLGAAEVELNDALNNLEFEERGPQWRLVNLVSEDVNRSVWVFACNHGMDDQQSVNIIAQDLLTYVGTDTSDIPTPLPFPTNVENAICPGSLNPLTLIWSIYQLYNSLTFPVVVPRRIKDGYQKDPDAFKEYVNPDTRKTFVELISFTSEQTKQLVLRSKANGVTVTSTLSAAMLIINAVLMQESGSASTHTELTDINLRFLLSVGLRPYGVQSQEKGSDWSQGTVACAGGAIDFNVNVPAEASLPVQNQLISGTGTDAMKMSSVFWEVAKQCQDMSRLLIKVGFVPESQRLFGFGMDWLDILRVVEMEARSTGTFGRGYSCGVSSVGVVNFQPNTPRNLMIDGVYYGTSHARNGVLCLLSCMTVNNSFTGCLQFPYPLIDQERAKRVKTALEQILLSI